MLKQSLVPLLVAVVLLAIGTTAHAQATFSDDFSFFDSSKWTHYGGDNVSVDSARPDVVYVDAARNWEPASRITHQMSTGYGDFTMSFDIRYVGGDQGIFHIGWADVNNFAYQQRHSDYSTINAWWETDSFVGASFGYYGRTSLAGSHDGTSMTGGGQFADMPLNQWHTVTIRRQGTTLTAQSTNRDTGASAGSLNMTLPTRDNYGYFHISTWDNMMNGRHTYYEVDNVALSAGNYELPRRDPPQTGPTVPPSISTQGALKIYQNGVFSTDVASRFDPTRPTVVLVHGWNKDGHESLGDDTNGFIYKACVGGGGQPGALNQRTSNVNVLVWDWLDQAKTDPDQGVPDEKVWSQAQSLKKSIAQVIDLDTYSQPMQLLGHSLGGGVATETAFYLKTQDDYSVDQLTVFDAPEGDGPIEWLGGCRPLGLDPAIEYLASQGLWVDNYPSQFGKRYAHSATSIIPTAANVDMRDGLPSPAGPSDWDENHSFPMAWYFGWDSGVSGASTPGTLDQNGLPSEGVGAGWSNALSLIPGISNRPAEAGTWEMLDRSDPYNITAAWSAAPPIRLAEELTLDDAEASGEAYLGMHGDSQFAFLITSSPVYLFKDISFDDESTAMSFTFFLDNPLPEDTLSLYFEDELLFVAYGSALATGDYDTGLIDIADFAGQSGTLTFIYNSLVDDQIAGIGNVEVYGVPEPASLLMMGVGALGLLRRRSA